MFKRFRKDKASTPVTVRVAELQVGDRIMYDTASVEVLDIIQDLDTSTYRVRLGSSLSKYCIKTRQVELYPELLCNVTR